MNRSALLHSFRLEWQSQWETDKLGLFCSSFKFINGLRRLLILFLIFTKIRNCTTKLSILHTSSCILSPWVLTKRTSRQNFHLSKLRSSHTLNSPTYRLMGSFMNSTIGNSIFWPSSPSRPNFLSIFSKSQRHLCPAPLLLLQPIKWCRHWWKSFLCSLHRERFTYD